MEVTGKVIKILEVNSYTSKKSGEVFKKFSFVVEIQGQYVKHILMIVLGEEKWNKFNIQVGGMYSFVIDIDAREWNGKWFNEIKCWSARSIGGSGDNANSHSNSQSKRGGDKPAAEPQVSQPEPESQQQEESDDLPF